MKVALGTLKDEGEALMTFLESRVGTKPGLSGGEITLDDEAMRKGVGPRQVKTYIKRFLFMKGVRKDYRVFVDGKELTIWEIEKGEAEEEEEKAKKEKVEEKMKAAEEKETEKREEGEAENKEAEKEAPKEEKKKPKKAKSPKKEAKPAKKKAATRKKSPKPE